jgi:hypothetical protein
MLWDKIWEWAINHYAYNAGVSVAVIIIIFNFLNRLKVFQGFSKFKKIKIGAGGLELEHKEEGDSEKDKQQDGVINDIKNELKDINKRLDAQYMYLRETAVQSGIGVVWSGTQAPFEEAIWAALNNIKLGQNGNLITRVVEIVMLEGKNGVKNYRSVLNKFINDDRNKNLSDHFYETIKAIEREIH